MRRILFIVMVCILGIGSFGCASYQDLANEDNRDKKADYLYEYGSTLLMDNKAGEAIRQLTEAWKIKPKDPRILNNLGLAYLMSGDRDEARAHFEKAVSYDEKFGDALINLGRLEMDAGRYSKARDYFTKASLDVTYRGVSNAFANVGLSYLREQNYTLAEKSFRKAVSLQPDHCEATLWLADSYALRGAHELSTQVYKRAVGLACPMVPFAHFKLARSYIKISHFDDARKKYKEIIERFPQSRYAALAQKELKNLP